MEVVQNGQTCTVYSDGALDGSTTNDKGQTTINYFEVGSTLDSFFMFRGEIVEIAIYTSAVSAANRLSLESYFRTRYALY